MTCFGIVYDPLKQTGLILNLKRPYTDQFSVALEREIFQNFSLSATFVYKNSVNIIAPNEHRCPVSRSSLLRCLWESDNHGL